MLGYPYKSTPSRTNQTRLRSQTPQKQSNNSSNNIHSKSLIKPINNNTSPPHNITQNNVINHLNNPNLKIYYVGKGNNHQIIKRILKIRANWVQCSSSNGAQYCHFKWVQNSQMLKFHLLGKQVHCFNHFQYHRQITNKQKLLQNMIHFCQANKINVYNYIPVTFIIDLNTGEQDLALHSFLKFYNRNVPEKYNGPRVNSIILPRNRLRYQPYLSPQQLNKRSQGNFYCKPHCTKMMFSKINENEQKDGVGYLWILKPTFLNRGRGVVVFNNLNQFQKLIWKYYQGQGLEDFELIEKKQDSNCKKEIIQIQNNPKIQQSVQLNITQQLPTSTIKQQLIIQINTNQNQQASPTKKLNSINKRTSIEQATINNVAKNQQINKNQLSKDSSTIFGNNEIKIQLNKKPISNKSNQTNKKQQTTHKKIEEQSNSKDKIKKHQSVKTQIKIIQDKVITTVGQQSLTSLKQTSTDQIQIQPQQQSKPRLMAFIVQKYLQRPLLINQYKFDIRIWVLLTQDLQLYFFKEGYLRLSSKPYSTSSGSHVDPFIHLTNNSVQKYSQDYDKQNGNQYPLNELLKYMSKQQYSKVCQKMREIVWLTLCSVRRKININSRKQCFQLFGYDFMIDQSFKVWLIEVNTNPAIEQASPILKVILPRMIDDMFKLTIDEIFPNSKLNTKTNKKLEEVIQQQHFPVPGYDNHQNLWQLLGDLRDGIKQKDIGKRLTFARR